MNRYDMTWRDFHPRPRAHWFSQWNGSVAQSNAFRAAVVVLVVAVILEVAKRWLP